MFFVYALYSEKCNKIYIGYSGNPEIRLQSHNSELNLGWTKSYRPWKLVYTEQCPSKTAALKREKQLKTASGRSFIWEIVKCKNYSFEH